MSLEKPRVSFFERVLEASTIATVVLDCTDDPSIVYVNPAFERLTGYACSEAHDRDWGFLWAVEADVHTVRKLHTAIWRGREDEARLRCCRKDGRIFLNQIHVAPLADDSAAVAYYVAVMHDVTADHEYREQLLHRAYHDALTGLANRHLFAERLEQAMTHARRHDERFALLFIDLDRFKQINDTFGHRIGDEMLRHIGARLTRDLRAGDTVARLGGDEFALLLRDAGDHDSIRPIVRRVMETVTEPVCIEGRRMAVSCSVGASFYPGSAADAQALLHQADLAMYRQKWHAVGRPPDEPMIAASRRRVRESPFPAAMGAAADCIL